MSSAFRTLESHTDLHDKHWRSYVGAIDNGNILFEHLSEKDEAIEEQLEDNGLNVRMISKCLNADNETCIYINGDNYTVNRRDLNFVA